MSNSASADAVRELLREHLAEVLYCETAEIGDEVTFKDLGLDSVLGAELVAVINARYGLEESLETVYAHPTLAALTGFVHSRVGAGEASAA